MELASANARLSGALVNPELPHVIDEKGRNDGAVGGVDIRSTVSTRVPVRGSPAVLGAVVRA